MLLHINPDNPQIRLIVRVVECLKQGGVIAYPTDTTYGIGCDIFNRRGVKSIYQIKQREARKPFSFICADLSDAATAVLTFDYAGYGAGGLDTVVTEISVDGGSTWTLLERMDVVGNESGSRSFNLESYTDLPADLQLRFRIAAGFDGSGQYINFDNVDMCTL